MLIEFKGKNYKIEPEFSTFPKKLVYQHLEAERDIQDKLWHPSESDVVLDIGSHLGSYTLKALAHGAEVLAFDPIQKFLDEMKIQIELNAFTKYTLFPLALVNTSNLIYMSQKMESVVVYDDDPLIIVNCSTLDKTIPKIIPTLIKIDVEGAEIEVLEGAKQTLRTHSPKVLIECHNCFFPNIDLDVINKMVEYGYREIGRIEHKKYDGLHLFFSKINPNVPHHLNPNNATPICQTKNNTCDLS